MKQRLFTVNEAAQAKGVSRTAIYSAIARQKLPRRYSKGHIVVREADLLEWQASKATGGRPKGKLMSEEAKRKISDANKLRWAKRKADNSS